MKGNSSKVVKRIGVFGMRLIGGAVGDLIVIVGKVERMEGRKSGAR